MICGQHFKQAPNNSFKPNPHRGSAWLLFRYPSSQSPARYGVGLVQALGRIRTSMRTPVTALVLSVILAACSLFDSGSNWKSDQFEVLWIDLHSDSHLAYRLDSTTSIGITEGCVFAAGANEQYVVVEQWPENSARTAFYVVAKGTFNPSRDNTKAVFGPFSELELRAFGKTVALPALESVMPAAVCRTAA